MVVLDTSGVLDAFTEMAFEVSTLVLWVTTTEFASVNDTLSAMRALRELSMPEDRFRFVVNAVSADDYGKPEVLGEILGRKMFWSLPYDPKVRRGAYVGEPVVLSQPGSAAAKSFNELARVIAGGRGAPNKPAKGFRWLPGRNADGMRPAAGPAAAAGG
jgi:MinD-like ATPase involved in chromosome partitioning or flagellar assembly